MIPHRISTELNSFANERACKSHISIRVWLPMCYGGGSRACASLIFFLSALSCQLNIALHCFALCRFALLCVASHCALRCFALRFALLRIAIFVASHCFVLLCIALHFFSLLCVALHCFVLRCITLERFERLNA